LERLNNSQLENVVCRERLASSNWKILSAASDEMFVPVGKSPLVETKWMHVRKITLGNICSRCLIAAWNPDLLHAFVVGVFAIVLADVLEQLIVRHAPIPKGECPGFLEDGGIFDGDVVAQDTVSA